MVTIDIEYLGDLRCRARHGPSGMEIETDAPTDNMGKGEAFSPTDLVATALGTCILTVMGTKAQAMGIEGNALIHWMHEQWCNKPTAQVQFELPAMEL